MKRIDYCPICRIRISTWIDDAPVCRDHGRFGFWIRIWYFLLGKY
jgi:hypothetical protein